MVGFALKVKQIERAHNARRFANVGNADPAFEILLVMQIAVFFFGSRHYSQYYSK